MGYISCPLQPDQQSARHSIDEQCCAISAFAFDAEASHAASQNGEAGNPSSSSISKAVIILPMMA